MYKDGDIINDRYIVRSIIGSGGSGRVYLASDVNIGKLWAVKEVDSGLLLGEEFARAEIQALKTLDFPMFPRITDAWQDNGNSYIVSDYIAGISLGKLIKEGPMSYKHAYKVASQIADALIFLHTHNPPILYLDLKPDNILIKPDGQIFLIDFGIACQADFARKGFGTPGFAPPEQYGGVGTNSVSERSDIFAFAATYFSMRTGCIPGPDAEVFAETVRNNSYLSSGEKRLILKCIHVNPEKRIKSMKLVRHNLDQINIPLIKICIRPFTVTLVLLLILFAIRTLFFKSDDYSDRLRRDVRGISCGEKYTENELKLMEEYINSGLASDEEKSHYLFEIGRTYFEEYEDYRRAKRYFEKLDVTMCPQKEYYLELCEFQTGFDYDADSVRRCLELFCADVMLMPDSETKYRNLLFASSSYELYFDNSAAGENRSYEILIGGRERLDVLKRNNPKGEWIDEMIKEYTRRIEQSRENGHYER